MAGERDARKIARLSDVSKKLSNPKRMTVIVRLLSAPGHSLIASEAWPPGVSNSMRTNYLKLLKPFLTAELQGNREAIYTLLPKVAPHLRETVAAIERLVAIVGKRSAKPPTVVAHVKRQQVSVSIDDDGKFIVDDVPVPKTRLADAIIRVINGGQI